MYSNDSKLLLKFKMEIIIISTDGQHKKHLSIFSPICYGFLFAGGNAELKCEIRLF